MNIIDIIGDIKFVDKNTKEVLFTIDKDALADWGEVLQSSSIKGKVVKEFLNDDDLYYIECPKTNLDKQIKK